METAVLDAFSGLLGYPDESRAPRLRAWLDGLAAERADLEPSLAPLRSYLDAHSPSELEEAFVRTFENNAERALELGWHLHGENYARGIFMARMRGLLRDHEVEETGELPDHVGHVLAVIGRAERGLADALARLVAVPALTKIEAGFRDQENPYAGVIRALRSYLEQGGVGDERREELST